MDTITVAQLKPGQEYRLSKRKNAKTFMALKIIPVSGDRWEENIERMPEIEGKLLLVGPCGTKRSGQIMLNPDLEVYINFTAEH